jgi:3',5'-cyclic AMP phosphodiesterase CpdA
LYTNIPEGGQIDDQQMAWVVNELAAAPREKAVLVAAHHPPFSADAHHGGSLYMKLLIDQAVQNAGRMPDMVLSGHIHNYQRFTRRVNTSWEVPYIVAGGSGYWHLHYVVDNSDGTDLVTPLIVPNSDVTLETYQDRRHGFMRLVVGPRGIAGEYFTVPRPQESWSAPAERVDAFAVDLNTHKMVK